MRILNKALWSLSIGLALGLPAMANTYSVCPNAANQGGFGSDTFTNSGCSVTMSITTDTDYARLLFDSSVAGYPANLTLGNLAGLNANVAFTAAQATDQPYYMLAFTDASGSLGQAASTDQILMLEFQSPNVSGTTMAFDPNSSLVNLYDNTTGQYLAGGQQDARTLSSWLSTYSSLNTESLQQIRIGIGLAGCCAVGSSAESLTVNSLDITTSSVPEPASLPLLLSVVSIVGLSTQRKRLLKSRE